MGILLGVSPSTAKIPMNGYQTIYRKRIIIMKANTSGTSGAHFQSNSYIFLLLLIFPIYCFASETGSLSISQQEYNSAIANGRLANEGFIRCDRYVRGWLMLSDAKTGLLPCRRRKDRVENFWNAEDCAADNYPFMVITSSFTDRQLFNGRMLEMLRTERKLTSRIDSMPDTFDFGKQDFLYDTANLDRILFGTSEYIKDGLLPVTEMLGNSPWSDRLIEMLDDMWKHASIQTANGKIVSNNIEINGEMLQTLSRIYWMTGDKKYLDWAIRLGDYYLLGSNHPTRDMDNLRLRDHGCEIVSGLCELYATAHFACSEKKKVYKKPLYEMLDRVLEVGRNGHGLFYDNITPKTGQAKGKGIADTWGYTLNGIYTVYLLDGQERYRDATLKAMSNLKDHYRNYPWEGQGADGYADSIESGLNLYNREPIASTAQWIDSEIQVMWKKQKPDGIIEGWYGDGNFARTTIMYCLWKTQGVKIDPWRKDVVFGAIKNGCTLAIAMTSSQDWDGKLFFDTPRHKTNMKMPLDWPRINQFPEWFVLTEDQRYNITCSTMALDVTGVGKEILKGLPISLKAGEKYLIQVNKK